MTHEVKELGATAKAPAEDETIAQKACKTQVILQSKENVPKTKRKNAKLQKHSKFHDKRS